MAAPPPVVGVQQQQRRRVGRAAPPPPQHVASPLLGGIDSDNDAGLSGACDHQTLGGLSCAGVGNNGTVTGSGSEPHRSTSVTMPRTSAKKKKHSGIEGRRLPAVSTACAVSPPGFCLVVGMHLHNPGLSNCIGLLPGQAHPSGAGRCHRAHPSTVGKYTTSHRRYAGGSPPAVSPCHPGTCAMHTAWKRRQPVRSMVQGIPLHPRNRDADHTPFFGCSGSRVPDHHQAATTRHFGYREHHADHGTYHFFGLRTP